MALQLAEGTTAEGTTAERMCRSYIRIKCGQADKEQEVHNTLRKMALFLRKQLLFFYLIWRSLLWKFF